jgi:hypothetical protein
VKHFETLCCNIPLCNTLNERVNPDQPGNSVTPGIPPVRAPAALGSRREIEKTHGHCEDAQGDAFHARHTTRRNFPETKFDPFDHGNR